MEEEKKHLNINAGPADVALNGVDLEKEEAEPLEVEIIAAPDGGWGWAVVFGAFITGVLVDGLAFTFGIIMIDMADYYNVSKMSISWAGSVMNGVYLTIGPLVGGLCNKFGCRPVALIGALVATLGFFTCIYSPTVNVLIILYGLVGGFGFGMLYLPSIVMVGFYFEKKRAFATGIAVCGSGIGAFIMAPVVEKLLDIYEWRGAQIILSAVIFHGLIVAMLFRPLEPRIAKFERSDTTAGYDSQINTVEMRNPANNCTETEDNPAVVRPCSIEIVLPEHTRERQFTSLSEIYVPKRKERTLSEGPGSQRKVDTLEFVRSCDESVLRRLDIHAQISHVDTQILQKDLLNPMSRRDIFYAGSVTHLPEYIIRGSDEYHRSMTMIRSSHFDEQKPPEKSKCCSPEKMEAVAEALSSMVDMSLLKSYTFLLYGFSCFLTMAGFFVPFMFLPDDAMLHGMSRDNAALLLSIIGITNTVGRIGCGWISDQKWADCVLINAVALMLGGAVTIAVPFLDHNFPLLCIYSCIFGLCIAVFVSLRSIIMVELIGLEKLTSAFGMVTLCQGISSFIGAPLAGGIYDSWGDYSISFYFAGSMLFVAGLVCFPCRRVAAYEKKKQQETR